MAKRVVLAYSGGLDTSVAVRWLREEWGVEVVACAVDVGQLAHGEEEIDPRRGRARPARSRSRSSTPATSSPTTSSCPRCAPTRSTKASTRSSPRCRAR